MSWCPAPPVAGPGPTPVCRKLRAASLPLGTFVTQLLFPKNLLSLSTVFKSKQIFLWIKERFPETWVRDKEKGQWVPEVF